MGGQHATPAPLPTNFIHQGHHSSHKATHNSCLLNLELIKIISNAKAHFLLLGTMLYSSCQEPSVRSSLTGTFSLPS